MAQPKAIQSVPKMVFQTAPMKAPTLASAWGSDWALSKAEWLVVASFHFLACWDEQEWAGSFAAQLDEKFEAGSVTTKAVEMAWLGWLWVITLFRCKEDRPFHPRKVEVLAEDLHSRQEDLRYVAR